ncbi:hypothetical protein GGC47_000530 [Bosea sp. OAE752]|uniref:hypothetical protein n=1 Tax=unclassified Bosea (in: a-proteobacteria) TaxID=2653178 RepID=UPI0011547577
MTVSATQLQAGEAADRTDGLRAPRLSTDFLNRYSEALMLIEMAESDDSVIEDLQSWRNLCYRGHFEISALRCAGEALVAYDRLDPARRKSFEEVCRSMARLVATVTALLVEKPRPAELPTIIEVASEALRRLITRSTQFINANGTIDIATFDDASLQGEIDALLAR